MGYKPEAHEAKGASSSMHAGTLIARAYTLVYLFEKLQSQIFILYTRQLCLPGLTTSHEPRFLVHINIST